MHTAPHPDAASAAHNKRARAICSRSAGTAASGSINARSLPPLPQRTISVRRSKSTSLTRNCKASVMRMPVP